MVGLAQIKLLELDLIKMKLISGLNWFWSDSIEIQLNADGNQLNLVKFKYLSFWFVNNSFKYCVWFRSNEFSPIQI